jgi:hypothetical protein
MSTRGLWGFKIDGDVKVTYNHFDSYPSGLGADLVKVLSSSNLEEMKTMARALTLVESDSRPTPKQKAALVEFTNLGVGEQSDDDWYCVLRETQGDLEQTLRSKHMIDSFQFGYDSLFCEWGYVIDFDADEFVVYRGFQESITNEGIWSDGQIDGDYGPIKPIYRVPLSEVNLNSLDGLVEE